jgi:RNA polymerase sigma-70 factor, ECF subfamily
MSEPQPDAVRWLAEARGGSREALGRLLQACRGYLLLVAQQQVDPELRAKGGASDLVQETFLEAQRDFAQFHGHSEAELLAWLRRLLLNNVADFSRRYQGTQKRGAAQEVALDGGSSGGGPPVAAEEPSPSGLAAANEQAALLQRALERLPEDYRQVIVLHHQEQRSFVEIGEVMGRSPEAVRKLWGRAIERLQQELKAPS